MYCMASQTAKKRAPHTRLKLLRKIIGVSQPELAKMIGVSQPYVLSIEIGQRELSRRVAEAVFVATLIHPDWLLGKIGEDDKPLDIGQSPFVEETYLSAKHPPTLTGPLHPNLLDGTFAWMRGVHILLRAAGRKGKYRMAEYYINNCIKDAKESLGLAAMMKSEAEEVQPPPTPHLGVPDAEAIWSSTLKRVLSPRAIADWREAYLGTDDQRRELLKTISEAYFVVAFSLEQKSPGITAAMQAATQQASAQPSPVTERSSKPREKKVQASSRS